METQVVETKFEKFILPEIKKCKPYMIRIAINIVHDRSWADDLEQEVTTTLYREFCKNDLSKVKNLTAYIKWLARCRTITKFNKDRSLLFILDEVENKIDPTDDYRGAIKIMNEVEIKELVEQGLKGLSEEDQQFVLEKIHGLSLEEVARRHGIDEDTAQRNLDLAWRRFWYRYRKYKKLAGTQSKGTAS